MAFSAGVNDEICTKINNIDLGYRLSQYYFFLVRITSCIPAENSITQ